MNKISKKAKVLIFCISIVVAIVCFITLFLHRIDNNAFNAQIDSKEKIASYRANYNYIDVYKQKDKIIINTYSDSKFDEPNRIVVPFEGKLSKSDILVKWKTANGDVIEQDSDSILAASIIIEKNGKTICNENINFCEKGWKVLNDVIGK
ncbi:hypothetical protein AC069_01460 [Gardnerella vaginalis]|jgi:hypothetical protein|uniref:Uncharacterized protein n=2 Tax=Gardnerella TaxID=2701 RepID=A0AAP8IPK2_GARVA|nr:MULTISPECIES: hypothetical protein [Gardnerella]RIY29929.1 hypothetical protein CJI49_01195 [Bifidobacteriaceae bacterium NR016]EPI52118.1 hypothetical protein HMPREF1576_00061 [Gardnerella pickettii JCP7719]EPI54277.1 hypothetical protein HMPREF1573_01473 [Gardnerella vaginalis JCP7276]KMT47171.1 hypothetical protein AC069_01460 [Gardnerella vaginalis]MDK6296000.1 hypothetical protein [Gardnerella swidsinskii]